jgi:hypothetical protein
MISAIHRGKLFLKVFMFEINFYEGAVGGIEGSDISATA